MTTRGDMMYRNASNVTARLPLGSQGQTLRAWDLDATWQEPIVPLRESRFFDDFMSTPGETVWTSTTSGGTVGATAPSVGNYVGVVTLTASSSTGRANISKNSITLRFGLGAFTSEFSIILPTLSIGAQEYLVRIGYGSSTTATDHTNGVYFEYNRATSGNFWIIKTANNNVHTTTVSASAIVANTWYRLGIQVNDVGTLATFLVNGVSIGTIATNIPTAINRFCSPNALISRVTSTSANSITLDYWNHVYNFTAVRY